MTEIESTQIAKIVSENELVLVDFSASWCGPCKTLKQTLHELEPSCKDKLTIFTCDVDECDPDIMASFKIRSIPMMVLFQHGKQVERWQGAFPLKDLQEKLAVYL